MFKQIIINGEETPFIVNEEGVVKNKQTNNVLKGTIRDGYRYYDLRFNHKKVSKSGHRLVAEAFIPNLHNYVYICHLDGDRLNNRICNIVWSSTPYIKTEWVNYYDTYYSVCNNQVRNNKTKRVLKIKNNKYTLKINCHNWEISIEEIHKYWLQPQIGVGQFDHEYNLIQIFPSCAEAARFMGCRFQSINSAIHNNYCSCGYYWKYIN